MSESTQKRGPAESFEKNRIRPALDRRRKIGSLRRLRPFHTTGTIDFSSNDYRELKITSIFEWKWSLTYISF